MTQNRKRGRNMQEDEVEFMPLSKRINNLHINGNLLMENGGFYETEWGPGPPFYSPEGGGQYSSPETPPESIPTPQFPLEPNVYQPSMNETENPHYFLKNKLLFEVHMERLQRLGGQNF